MRTGLPTQTVNIDGTEYEITTLDAIKARRVWVKLFKALGPGLESAAGFGGQEAGLKLLGATLERLPDELLGELADTYAASCTVLTDEGRRPTVQSVAQFHFAGRPLHWMKWLIECTKVNFADFLAAASGPGLGSLLSGFQSKSPSI